MLFQYHNACPCSRIRSDAREKNKIAKIQTPKFAAEARRQQGEKFILRAFHDFVY